MSVPFNSKEPHAIVTHNGVRFTLLGTAHVSQKSVEAVTQALNSNQFDAVAVELCEVREQRMFSASKSAPTWSEDLESSGVRTALFNRAMRKMYTTVSAKIGVPGGSEFKAAVTLARKKNLRCVLIDQDVRITARRVAKELGLPKLLGMSAFMQLGMLLIKVMDKGDVVEMIENSKNPKNARKININALVKERDAYMVEQLCQLRGAKEVLVVVGANHLPGMVELFNSR